MTEVINFLMDNQDEKYRDFQSPLMPTVDSQSIIGVRTPILKKYAKSLIKEGKHFKFLNELPHKYFDENQLHAYIICELYGFEQAMEYTQKFLPNIDNWATCDGLSPKAFAKQRKALLPYIYEWLNCDKTYTIRFAVLNLMRHFLDEDFDESYLETVSKIKSEQYYVNMMCAWYFATALAKQYESTITFFEQNKIPKWVHNKAISKANDSYRISKEHKEYLKTLRIR